MVIIKEGGVFLGRVNETSYMELFFPVDYRTQWFAAATGEDGRKEIIRKINVGGGGAFYNVGGEREAFHCKKCI